MKYLTLPLLVLFLFSCMGSQPKIDASSEEAFEASLKKVKEGLEGDELEKFETSMSVILMSNVDLSDFLNSDEDEEEIMKRYLKKFHNKTAFDIITEAENLTPESGEEKSLSQRGKMVEEAKKKKLKETLDVAIFEKGFTEYNYSEYITLKFAFENKSEKAIRAFKGTVVINDIFNDLIDKKELKYDKGIKSGEVKNWDAQVDFNQFLDESVKLRNTDLKDLKIIWEPETIIFEDGSEISMN